VEELTNVSRGDRPDLARLLLCKKCMSKVSSCSAIEGHDNAGSDAISELRAETDGVIGQLIRLVVLLAADIGNREFE
jgi:hypothetical protein